MTIADIFNNSDALDIDEHYDTSVPTGELDDCLCKSSNGRYKCLAHMLIDGEIDAA